MLFYIDKGKMIPFDLHREWNNSVAFIIGGGPSLKQINPKHLNGKNRIVMAQNNTYPFVRPDIWLGMDDPICYNRELFWEPFIKIMRAGYEKRYIIDDDKNKIPYHANYNQYFASLKKPKDPIEIFKNLKRKSNFVWHSNTFAISLHLAMWMGCKSIFLFGCDFSTKKQAYYDGTTLDKRFLIWNNNLYANLDKYLRWFSHTSPKYGVTVYSCSKDSMINEYVKYIPYLEVIYNLEKDLPYGGKKLHAVEGEEWLIENGLHPTKKKKDLTKSKKKFQMVKASDN
jgi:hypothetical protein